MPISLWVWEDQTKLHPLDLSVELIWSWSETMVEIKRIIQIGLWRLSNCPGCHSSYLLVINLGIVLNNVILQHSIMLYCRLYTCESVNRGMVVSQMCFMLQIQKDRAAFQLLKRKALTAEIVMVDFVYGIGYGRCLSSNRQILS